MSPLLIVIIAPLGVALLIGLVALLDGNTLAVLIDADDALARFRKDFPDWAGDQAIVSDDGHIALLTTDGSDRVGLVFAVGDCFATRLVTIADFDIQSDAQADELSDARLHFHDFTAPDITVPRALISRANLAIAA